MKRFLIGAGVLGLALAMSTLYVDAQGQGRGGRGGGAAFTNLQVFPSDVDRQQLFEAMNAFEAALGVDCAYCHVYSGRDAPGNDLASDAKVPKRVARVMMRMTQQVNQTIAAGVDKPADAITRVQCITCHRGSAIPVVARPAAQ